MSSHPSSLADLFHIPNTQSQLPQRTNLPPLHYTIHPQHPPPPLFTHQFPHHLPLPHQYHTQYTPTPHPLSYSSIMSSG
ncbi:immune inhibitor A domain-containing protein, partial [Bacillus altitudinis]|uniref:immune inhibitor A domain-containing protein n=1 Tax=Bacillus altitudinis TaxID=293387 RepID=UPI002356683D